jgi:drug/metabolite transporter (DMT)-like permease
MSGRMVGSPVVNRTRLLIALVLVSLMHWAMQGELLPIHAAEWRWGWMALSGLIGFVLGDVMLFQAFVMIGPRLSMLLMALAPVMGAMMAWVLLNETLAPVEIIGILLAIGGVAWVVTDRSKEANGGVVDTSSRYYLIGVLLGLGGALGQAGGLIASKKGLEGDFSALSGNLMRIVVSTIFMWGLAAGQRQVGNTVHLLREHPRALGIISAGAVFGPFVGVWLSLIAVQHASVGVASTLMSLTPVILLPVSYVLVREKITSRAIVGTMLAFAGTAVLFLS